MSMIRYPLPVTIAMLAPANPRVDYPRYSNLADWSNGVVGNEADISARSEPVVGAASAASITPYPIRTQTAKGAGMVPPLSIMADIGKDYGTYAGAAGRTGTITPQTPYPDANSPPAVTSVSPNTGGIAGGTSVTITGTGFTGATAVTFGGTPATAVTVVSANTITCTCPAKAAGTVDVQVVTPKGQSPISGASDNFVYA